LRDLASWYRELAAQAASPAVRKVRLGAANGFDRLAREIERGCRAADPGCNNLPR